MKTTILTLIAIIIAIGIFIIWTLMFLTSPEGVEWLARPAATMTRKEVLLVIVAVVALLKL